MECLPTYLLLPLPTLFNLELEGVKDKDSQSALEPVNRAEVAANPVVHSYVPSMRLEVATIVTVNILSPKYSTGIISIISSSPQS